VIDASAAASSRTSATSSGLLRYENMRGTLFLFCSGSQGPVLDQFVE
jgi:hypothetical protein